MSDPLEAMAPKWSTKSFHNFLNDQDNAQKLLNLCKGGLHNAILGPEIVSFLAETDKDASQDRTSALKRAKERAELANLEVKAGFPRLHAQFIVSSWTSLETLILSVVSDHLLHEVGILQKDPWRNLKIKLGEYDGLDPEQRVSHLVSVMDQALGAPLKGGVNRFETLLETVGLKGVIPEELGKSLFELQQVRNAIVHKRGIADHKFKVACPWVEATQGELIYVSEPMLANYLAAVMEYVIELICRNGEHFGAMDIRQRRPKLR
jgi:hypothetical protein